MRSWDQNGQEFFAKTVLYNLLSSSKLVNYLVPNEHRSVRPLISHDWIAAIAGIVARRNLKIPFVFHFHSTEQGRNPRGSVTIKEIEGAFPR